MKQSITKTLSIISVILILVIFLYRFIYSIDINTLFNRSSTLSAAQIQYLILIISSFIYLYEFIEQPLAKMRLSKMLIGKHNYNDIIFILLNLSKYIISVPLILLGFFIPLLDLLGIFTFGMPIDFPEMSLKITILMLTSTYLVLLFERSTSQVKMVHNILYKTGSINIMSRDEDHAMMASILEELSEGDEIYVTHFEEPQQPMEEEGYYYERDFMRKWYSTIKAKSLIVRQIVLINSKQDISDLEKRLKIVENIPTYYLSYILGPPSLIFVDFIVFKDRYAIIGMSDIMEARNMNIFGISIKVYYFLVGDEKIYRLIMVYCRYGFNNLFVERKTALFCLQRGICEEPVIVRPSLAEAIAFSIETQARRNDQVYFLKGNGHTGYGIAQARDFRRKAGLQGIYADRNHMSLLPGDLGNDDDLVKLPCGQYSFGCVDLVRQGKVQHNDRGAFKLRRRNEVMAGSLALFGALPGRHIKQTFLQVEAQLLLVHLLVPIHIGFLAGFAILYQCLELL